VLSILVNYFNLKRLNKVAAPHFAINFNPGPQVLQARSFGQIDLEFIPPALIAAGHLGAGVA
jgi:hypothetical protein